MSKYYKPIAETILYLNSDFNCTITQNAGGHNTDFTFVVPDINIQDLGYLSVINILPINYSTTNPYVFRIKNIEYDSKNYFCSDYGYPIILTSLFGTVVSSGLLGVAKYGLTLPSQTIRSITINVSDSNFLLNDGVATAFQFILGLKIEEFDPKISEVGDPYTEGRHNMKLAGYD